MDDEFYMLNLKNKFVQIFEYKPTMLRWVLLRWNFVSNYIVLWSYLIHRNSSPLKSEVMRLYITVKCDQPESIYNYIGIPVYT